MLVLNQFHRNMPPRDFFPPSDHIGVQVLLFFWSFGFSFKSLNTNSGEKQVGLLMSLIHWITSQIFNIKFNRPWFCNFYWISCSVNCNQNNSALNIGLKVDKPSGLGILTDESWHSTGQHLAKMRRVCFHFPFRNIVRTIINTVYKYQHYGSATGEKLKSPYHRKPSYMLKVGLECGTWFQIVFAWVPLLWIPSGECAEGQSWL